MPMRKYQAESAAPGPFDVDQTPKLVLSDTPKPSAIDMEGFYGAIETEDGGIIPVASVIGFTIIPNTARRITTVRIATAGETYTLSTHVNKEEARIALRALVEQIYGPIYKPEVEQFGIQDSQRDVPMTPVPESATQTKDPRLLAGIFPPGYEPGTDPQW